MMQNLINILNFFLFLFIHIYGSVLNHCIPLFKMLFIVGGGGGEKEEKKKETERFKSFIIDII